MKKRNVHPRALVTSVLGLVLVAASGAQIYPVRMDERGVEPAGSAAASMVLTDGGIRFADGTEQSTAAAASAPAGVEDTGQRGCWDTSGSETSCAGSGQDGELQVGLVWPSPRFADNGDGTVTDGLTGLIWLKDANCFGDRLWADALADANGLASGSCGLTDGSVATDWRLPNIKELSSLVDYGEAFPALPPSHPFSQVQSSDYWTSSTMVRITDAAWYVFMQNGTAKFSQKNVLLLVWPVRDGQ